MSLRMRWILVLFSVFMVFSMYYSYQNLGNAWAQEDSGEMPPEIEEAAAKSWFWDTTEKGGPLMWGIYGAMVIGTAIALEKMYKLRIKKLFPAAFIEQVRKHLKERNIPEAIALCEGKKFPLARIIRSGLLQYNDGIKEVAQAIEGSGNLEVAILGNHMRLLGTMGNISTMVGLLGTITGMIKSFEAIAASGSGRPDLVAKGISEAMITTAGGLFAAIPITLLYSFLMGKIDNIIIELEEISMDLIEELTFGQMIEE